MAEDYVFIVYRVDLHGLTTLPKRARQFEEYIAREACERDARWRENPWDTLIKIKGVFSEEKYAEQEVVRLNKLNADKPCRYFWQGARLYPEGRKSQQTQDTD